MTELDALGIQTMTTKISHDFYASLNLPQEASDREVIRSVLAHLAPPFIQSPRWKPARHLFLKAVLDYHQIIQSTR